MDCKPCIITTLFLLSLVCFRSVSGQACSICYDRRSLGSEFTNMVLDSDASGDYTCQHYATAALSIDETDVKCESYYRLIGKERCGCPRPPMAPSLNEMCHLCINRALPPLNNVIDITKLGNWEAGGITCSETRDYLVNFLVSDNACQKFHQIGVQNCGCTDLLPTASPTTSPTFVDEVKIDCDALANGAFPTINSDYAQSTNIAYSMELQLAEGYSFDDVTSPLQDQMDIIISLELNNHCSTTSVRRLEIRRNLGNMIIHYVDFENLTDVGGGIATGDAKVVYSDLPGETRARALVQEEELQKIVIDSITKNSEKIASSVDGVVGVKGNLSSDPGSPDPLNGNQGVVIGVSVGCAVIALAAGILVTKKKGKREDLSTDLDRLEFLPPAQKRSDQELVPPLEKKDMEIYPEDFSTGGDSLSTNQRDIVVPLSNAIEMEAAPKFGLNDTFPIKYPQFQDSDSSDSDVVLNNDGKRPIAFRRNISHRSKNTMTF